MSYEDGPLMSMKLPIYLNKGLYFYQNEEERWIFQEIFEIIQESGGSNSFWQHCP